MRKLIEGEQKNLIECDGCDFIIPNIDPKNPADGREYINIACPKCGENLLTKEDYLLAKKLDNYINWINRWFGWLVYFFPKSRNVTEVKVHNGIKIVDKK